MDYIAHIRNADGKIQSVDEHLKGVQALAEQFGSKIEVKHLAGLAGLLHDTGKYSDSFRNYIIEAVNNPKNPPRKGSIDHSTAGGKYLFNKIHEKQDSKCKLIAEIVGNVIISHHSGLQDFLGPELSSDYLRRVGEKELLEYDDAISNFLKASISEEKLNEYIKFGLLEIENIIKKQKTSEQVFLTIMFLTKYIFSCLIDADRTNTRMFEEDEKETPEINSGQLFNKYYEKLLYHLEELQKHKESVSPINVLRAKMSDQCDEFGGKPSGIYTLSIPTGGGKTLASLRYSLKHAIEHKKERIIYVVPYTTIIEQNADEVRKILDENLNVLEHHSNIVEEVEGEGNYVKDKLYNLAKDNWDSPIIFTTMVQFLNVFYSSGTRNVRRLHNLANSIIIFDEVQSVPIKCVSLFNEALNFLKNTCNTSILLCTATQPALDFVKHGIEKIDGEIIENINLVRTAFKRVNVIDKTTSAGWDTDGLSEFIGEEIKNVSSLLVILNTKTVVRSLFEKLENQKEHGVLIFHLSTSMCAANRKAVLKDVKDALKNKQKVICVSTQLIEAGVDISFDCVIRSLAGLDSIAQAAGRCNRHGKDPIRNVYVINHNEERLSQLKEIKIAREITSAIFKDMKKDPELFDGNLLSGESLELYFKRYYTELEIDLNYYVPKLEKELIELLSTNQQYRDGYRNKYQQNLPLVMGMSFKTAAKYFNVIENKTTSIIVPYKGGSDIIADLNGDISISDMYNLLKKSQQYIVNIFEYEKDLLKDDIVPLCDGKVLALKETSYDKVFGINYQGDGRMDSLFS